MAPDTISVLDQWYRYEEIAMHFNNLLMQFRLQLIGGVGLIGTIASYLIGGKIERNVQRHWISSVFSAGLLALITSMAFLDLFYYSRLLEGAVRALIEFEGKHPEIQMSTRIEEIVGIGKYAIWISYSLVLGLLLAFTIWSFREHGRLRRAAGLGRTPKKGVRSRA